ncbi:MAG: hypothetical protein ACK47R_21550, partial [Planctomycetia bacterium]
TPRWGLENIAYAPTGHDGNGLFMFSGLGNMLTPVSFLPQRGMMRKPRATPWVRKGTKTNPSPEGAE